MSEAQVKAALEQEEAAALKQGAIALHTTSPSSFVTMALEIEDSQCVYGLLAFFFFCSSLTKENRRRIRRSAKAAQGGSSSQRDALLKDQRNSLLEQLQAWEALLAVYAPGLLEYKASLRSESPATSSASEKVEDVVVWLPSRIPASQRSSVWIKDLPATEAKLRTAQCTDALDSLRRILRIKSRMIQFKNKNLRGQRSGTRSRAVIDRVHERARAAAEKYRCARAAKLELVGPGDWEKLHQVLADGDIRGYQDPNRLRPKKPRKGIWEDGEEEEAEGEPGATEPGDGEEAVEETEFELFNEPRTKRDGTGETRRTLSWIWTTEGDGGSIAKPAEKGTRHDVETTGDEMEVLPRSTTETTPADTDTVEDTTATGDGGDTSKGKKKAGVKKKVDGDDILRSEWARSRVRVERAKEEVMMVKEEMSRVLRYLGWKERWWMERASMREGVSKELAEGIQAYAISQAGIQRGLASKFRELWKDPLATNVSEDSDSSGDEDDEEGEGQDDDKGSNNEEEEGEGQDDDEGNNSEEEEGDDDGHED